MNNIKNTLRAGFVAVAGLVTMYSCTETWNDHYDGTASLGYEGTTMQAIEEKAPDFAKIIKAYGYDRELNSDNVFTVWAPVDDSFKLSDYLDEQGNMYADSAEVVKQFIKNHIARYAIPLSPEDQSFSLMNEKRGTMTADGKFGGATIIESNLACKNGILHIINTTSAYSYNLFELIKKQYEDDTEPGKDTLSLYAYLYADENNKDSLIESKSVSRGVDENGDKIWVDSFLLRNNTVLKNVDALLYEEDSSYIAILPTAKAWAERYKQAEDLLVFNPYEDTRSEGACDSLKHHYANIFAMTDLFFNKNANEHWEDSLKSTNYMGYPWWEHVYYSKMPKNMPEDKQLNDILSKCGPKIACSNGDGYIVDEYPMSITEQFFKKINVRANASSINQDLDAKGALAFTKNTSGTFRTTTGTFTFTLLDSLDNIVSRTTQSYSYVDIVPSSANANPSVAFEIPNTLSGTYDMYVVTCPIFLSQTGTNIDMDPRPYRFYTNIFERINEKKNMGTYPSSGQRIPNPDGSGNIFETKGLQITDDGIVINDTTYLGQYTFQNAYYGRNEEGVLIQFQSNIPSKQTSQYSREMLISSLILKPHEEGAEEIQILPPEDEAAKVRVRKDIKSIIISNKHN